MEHPQTGWQCLAMAFAMVISVHATTIVIEAEMTADGAWSAQALEGASGGQVLFTAARTIESAKPLPMVLPTAGAYRVWVRYHRAKPTSPGILLLLRDDAGEVLAYHFVDWSPIMPTERPYEEPTTAAGGQTGFIWESFAVTAERPLQATLHVGGYATGAARQRKGVADRQVDCFVVTDDATFDPTPLDAADLEKLVVPMPALAIPAPPAPFVWAAGSPTHVDAFAGAHEGHRFEAGLINNGQNYRDDVRAVRLGFNHDHGRPTGESAAAGILTHAVVESYRVDARQLGKEYPEPEGRFVNAEGKVSAATFSFHFPPTAAAAEEALKTKVQAILDSPLNDTYTAWRTSVEDGGFMDYSPVAQAAFRDWLKAKHGDIATLNRRWRSDYADFDAIVPPPDFATNRPAWLEFRDFSGQSYAEAVARQMPVIRQLDPKQRMCIGANSSLDLLAPYFSALRPIDFDQLLSTAYADQPIVSWDTYCGDDQIGCETEMMRSFADWRPPVIQEWSNHAVDARLAARSYWTMVGKGVAGIYLFMFHEGRGHATYPKWALLSHEGYPKPKLAAYADAVQEVHRLEPLLAGGTYTHAVKPIALYWSRIDLSLAKPYGSLYGTTLNSPIHVYATLRSLGYPVRWITPRQIRAGQLDQVSAVVLAGCMYIPGDVATSLEGWVQAGGVILGDELPGAWNEFGQPQETLAPVFGVQVKAPKNTKTGTLAVQESTQGYGEVTDAAVERKETFTMVEEIAQQPGATHPVALAIGDYMLSGIGPQPMTCVAGTVVGMTHRGNTGLVVNDYGQGHAFYSALMLGTIYEGSGTEYEWNATHSGLAYGRALDAFLQYAGVAKGSEVIGLPPAVRAKLRVESPIIAKDGNLTVGLISFNDAPVGPFELRVKLPAGADTFTSYFAVTGGSRALTPLTGIIVDGALRVTMPSFDTHATLIALKDNPPLIGLDLRGVTRGTAGLATVAAGQAIDVTATIHNPSSRPLAAGEVALNLPAGWLQSSLALAVPAIPPGGSQTVTFQVQAPDVAGPQRLRPFLARYRNAATVSTPATEMVWWGSAIRQP